MDKYQQIALLAQAGDIIYRLLPFAEPEYKATLMEIAGSIADLADTIEEDD